ncbi:MAG: hypothetical protein IJL66_09210 [Lachnospiraceae bacterium]|nr:hypothetical protein [Lachnospiraceae bacterium]
MIKTFTSKRNLALLFVLSVLILWCAAPQTARAAETDLTEDLLKEIRSRIDRVFEAGETEVDLTDMNIIVNMYADRFGAQYKKILDLCSSYAEDRGSFILGSHKEPYVGFSPSTVPAEGANKYGVGPNHLTGITVQYEEYYRRPDGTADLELIARTQETLTREYEQALSVVSDGMSDVEKALALYDYLIAVCNYPDVKSIDENGIETYDDESYSALSVFRDHISVCVANATAYCYLLSDSGIPCIRVDSDEMRHSWMMLKVDGEWYHADPTWDNIRYMDGWTSQWDGNNDIWDLGAANHEYFLKSDEEMINDLDHYNWSLAVDYTKDKSVKKTPKSGPSGRYADTFFGRDSHWMINVHYSYEDGEWYFPDRGRNKIVHLPYGADLNDASYIDAPTDFVMKYVFGSGGCLFICEDDGIWRYRIADGAMEKLPLTEESADRGLPCFTEMNIASGRLNFVVRYEDSQTDPVFDELSYPVEEVLAMAVTPETEPETTQEETTQAASEPDTQAETEAPETGTEAQTETGAVPPASTEAAAEDPGETGKKGPGALPFVLIGLAAAGGIAGFLVYRKKNRG